MNESTLSNKEIAIPDCWRPEVLCCLQSKTMTNSTRNEMFRTLVNLLFTTSHKPTRDDCNHMAQKLILKYPFAKDDLGNGYVSLHSIITCVSNNTCTLCNVAVME